MMGDECTEEHTFQPKVNSRPKYLEKNRQDSHDSLDKLAGGNDIFEQPLPGSRPTVNPGGIHVIDNPPSPSSDALGNEMKRFPHQQQNAQMQQYGHPPRQRQFPSQPQQSESPYKSKFMQQYDEQRHDNDSQLYQHQDNQQSMKSNIVEEVDSNFLNSLRSDSTASDNGGWNNDTTNAEIPNLGPPKRKVSYRRRKVTDNPSAMYPPAPTYSSNRKHAPTQSQSHDPPPWNSDNLFDPDSIPTSHIGDRSNVKSTPTSMPDTNLDQGFIGNKTGPQKHGDIGHARSRLSLLKTKMRRSDSGNYAERPNNGEATNLPKNPPKENPAPSRRKQQQLEQGWNSDFADNTIPDVPLPTKPGRRPAQQNRHSKAQQHQLQQNHQGEAGWNNDFTDSSSMINAQQPKSIHKGRSNSGTTTSRQLQQHKNSQQTRWHDSSEMENDFNSASLPNSAAGGKRDNNNGSTNERQRKPARQSQHSRPQHLEQQHSQMPLMHQLPPDAFPPSNDPFGSGMDNGPVGEQKQCPDCGRKFNPIPFEKHVKICAKVFLEKRKAFDSKKMRIQSVAAENPDIVKVLKEKAKDERKNKNNKPGANSRAIAASKKAKWKAESEAFRAAMRAGKKVTQALASGGPMPEQVISEPDPSLVPCPNCGRTFNENAAERHIPHCKNIRAKPTTLKRGTGGAGGKIGQSMKSKKGAKNR